MRRDFARRLTHLERRSGGVAPFVLFQRGGETEAEALARHRRAYPNSGPVIFGGEEQELTSTEWTAKFRPGEIGNA